ncbi:DUF397 domain-containing protein [Streptomyces sp. NPDC056909]
MTTETPRWSTSSYSDNGGQCVEVAARTSKRRTGDLRGGRGLWAGLI